MGESINQVSPPTQSRQIMPSGVRDSIPGRGWAGLLEMVEGGRQTLTAVRLNSH